MTDKPFAAQLAELHAAATLGLGFTAIQAERKRQRGQEHYRAPHDDNHTDGSLFTAALFYEKHGRGRWPWSNYPKLTTPERDLEKAGALYLAEADRLSRAGQEDQARLVQERAKDCGTQIDQLHAAQLGIEMQPHTAAILALVEAADHAKQFIPTYPERSPAYLAYIDLDAALEALNG